MKFTPCHKMCIKDIVFGQTCVMCITALKAYIIQGEG